MKITHYIDANGNIVTEFVDDWDSLLSVFGVIRTSAATATSAPAPKQRKPRTKKRPPEVYGGEPFTGYRFTREESGALDDARAMLKLNDLDKEVTPEPSPELWDDPNEDE